MDSIIVVWPDYDWCWETELHEYTWKSDDYTKVEWQSEEEPTENQLKFIADNGYLRTEEDDTSLVRMEYPTNLIINSKGT